MSGSPISIENLWKQITVIISEGKNHIILWGFNEDTIELLHRINAKGLASHISAIVESNHELVGRKIGNFIVQSPDSIQKLELDALVIVSDNDKEKIIKLFSKIDNRKPQIIISGIGHLEFQDSLYNEIFSSSFVSSRAFGYKNMLIHIYQSLIYISKNKLKGNIAEFGVYKGGTTVFLAKVVKSLGMKTKIFAFDTFSGFPPKKSVLDMYDDPHDEFFDFDSVSNHCKPYDIELIKGDISETYRKIEGIPLVLSFFDTDNYSPTKSALELCYDQTVKGGIMAFDHYYCDERWIYTLGERIAVMEFFETKNVFNLYGTGIFIKL